MGGRIFGARVENGETPGMRDFLTARQMTLASVAGAVIAAVALLAIPVAAQACAVCWGSSQDHSFTWGILFLMAMPFTIVGVIGGWLVYRYRHRSGGDLQKTALPRPSPTTQPTQKESRT